MPGLTAMDYLLVAIVAASTVIGLFRGFVREVMSVVVWLVALWAAWRFGTLLAPQLAGLIENAFLRAWASRGLILAAALIAGGVLTWLLARTLSATGLGGTDRAVGMVFGMIRGVGLAALAVLALDLAGLDAEPWWRDSKLIPYAAPVADALRDAAEKGLERLQHSPIMVVPLTGSDARQG